MPTTQWNKKNLPDILFSGRDDWCFGEEFFIQAALFQRAGGVLFKATVENDEAHKTEASA